MIYRGSFGEISNKADWISRTYTLTNESDNTDVDLSSGSITVAIDIVIRRQGSTTDEVTGSLTDGKVALSGGAFFWHFVPDDLSNLCAATYDIGVAVTIDSVKHDVILATVAVVEGV